MTAFHALIAYARDRVAHRPVDSVVLAAGSPLVKAAIFGADPNWGRILATVGARAGSLDLPIDPHQSRVAIQGVVVYDKAPIPFDRIAIKAKLRDPEIAILVELRAGDHIAKAYGCDLTYDYVKLNADYTSMIIEKPRDDHRPTSETATRAKPGVEIQYGPTMPNSPRNEFTMPKSPLNMMRHTSAIAAGIAT